MNEDDIPTINGAMRSTGGTFYELPSRRFQLDGTPDEATAAYIKEVERTYVLAKRAANENPEVALRAAIAFRKHADQLEFLAVQRRFASPIAKRQERRREQVREENERP